MDYKETCLYREGERLIAHGEALIRIGTLLKNGKTTVGQVAEEAHLARLSLDFNVRAMMKDE